MTRQSEELLEAALQLEKDERAELAARILESIAPVVPDDEVERAWAAEIDRRAGRVTSGGPEGEVGAEVFERVRRDVLRR